MTPVTYAFNSTNLEWEHVVRGVNLEKVWRDWIRPATWQGLPSAAMLRVIHRNTYPVAVPRLHSICIVSHCAVMGTGVGYVARR